MVSHRVISNSQISFFFRGISWIHNYFSIIHIVLKVNFSMFLMLLLGTMPDICFKLLKNVLLLGCLVNKMFWIKCFEQFSSCLFPLLTFSEIKYDNKKFYTFLCNLIWSSKFGGFLFIGPHNAFREWYFYLTNFTLVECDDWIWSPCNFFEFQEKFIKKNSPIKELYWGTFQCKISLFFKYIKFSIILFFHKI
jgi:hypothetical protein